MAGSGSPSSLIQRCTVIALILIEVIRGISGSEILKQYFSPGWVSNQWPFEWQSRRWPLDYREPYVKTSLQSVSAMFGCHIYRLQLWEFWWLDWQSVLDNHVVVSFRLNQGYGKATCSWRVWNKQLRWMACRVLDNRAWDGVNGGNEWQSASTWWSSDVIDKEGW